MGVLATEIMELYVRLFHNNCYDVPLLVGVTWALGQPNSVVSFFQLLLHQMMELLQVGLSYVVPVYLFSFVYRSSCCSLVLWLRFCAPYGVSVVASGMVLAGTKLAASNRCPSQQSPRASRRQCNEDKMFGKGTSVTIQKLCRSALPSLFLISITDPWEIT